jgi:DHA1 family bicyclomycin/chloramphenicol resistance-like MFS transporter
MNAVTGAAMDSGGAPSGIGDPGVVCSPAHAQDIACAAPAPPAPLYCEGKSALPEARAISPGQLTLMLGSMAALIPMSMDLYLPAIPTMARNVHASAAAGQLTLASFFLGLSVGQLFYGRSADRFGRRPVFFAGAVLFIGASLGCAFAPNIETLIAFRLLQAIGGCAATVISRAVLFDLYDSRTAAQFLSRMLLIMGLAPIVAPLAGGWITVVFGWRPLFLLLAGFCTLMTASVYFLLPETRSAEGRTFSRGESVLGSYLAVLRNGPLLQVTIAGAFGSSAFFAYLSNAPQLLIEVYKIPTEQFGYYFGANAIGFVGFAQLNRALLGQHSPSTILTRATIFACGAALLMLIGSEIPALGKWGVIVPMFLLMSCNSFIMPNSMAIAQAYDHMRPGAVAAVSGSLTTACGALVAILSSVTFDGTAVPMTMVILGALLVALVLRLTATPPQPLAPTG